MKKVFYYIVIIIVLISCKGPKTVYGDINSGVQEFKEGDTRCILFMDLFKNDKVKVIQNDSVIFEKKIVSKYGWADTLYVNKNYNTELFINNSNKPFVITSNQLQQYLYCYIFYYKNRYYIEFKDRMERFYGYNPFFKYYEARDFNCKIIDIDSCGEAYYIVLKEKGLFKSKKLKVISSSKIDTLITDLPKIKIGESYEFFLNDFYTVSDRITTKSLGKKYESKFWGDNDCKSLEKYKDVKYYSNYNLINLHYNK